MVRGCSVGWGGRQGKEGVLMPGNVVSLLSGNLSLREAFTESIEGREEKGVEEGKE